MHRALKIYRKRGTHERLEGRKERILNELEYGTIHHGFESAKKTVPDGIIQ